MKKILLYGLTAAIAGSAAIGYTPISSFAASTADKTSGQTETSLQSTDMAFSSYDDAILYKQKVEEMLSEYSSVGTNVSELEAKLADSKQHLEKIASDKATIEDDAYDEELNRNIEYMQARLKECEDEISRKLQDTKESLAAALGISESDEDVQESETIEVEQITDETEKAQARAKVKESMEARAKADSEEDHLTVVQAQSEQKGSNSNKAKAANKYTASYDSGSTDEEASYDVARADTAAGNEDVTSDETAGDNKSEAQAADSSQAYSQASYEENATAPSEDSDDQENYDTASEDSESEDSSSDAEVSEDTASDTDVSEDTSSDTDVSEDTDSDTDSSSSETNTSEYVWPVDSDTITSYYGTREAPTEGASTDHKGVDISADEGSSIYSAISGTVTESGYDDTRGNYVIVTNEEGVSTTYEHCSEVTASTGDIVSSGDTIATVGSTGNATGSHLHFEVTMDGEYVDPTTLYSDDSDSSYDSDYDDSSDSSYDYDYDDSYDSSYDYDYDDSYDSSYDYDYDDSSDSSYDYDYDSSYDYDYNY